MPEPSSRAALIRRWVTGTFSGRALIVGAGLKLIALLARLFVGPLRGVEIVDTLGDMILVAGAVILIYRLFIDVKRVVLWRVRRKLTLSYVFIGFVPALLIMAFFVVAVLLLFFDIGAYMTRTQLNNLVDETRFFAESTAVALRQATSRDDIDRILLARGQSLAARHPDASLAIVPTEKTCAGPPPRVVVPALAAGRWAHLAPPTSVPIWVPCTGYADLVSYQNGDGTGVAARAAVWADGVQRMVLVDVPVGEQFVRTLRDRAGIVLHDVRESSSTLADATGLGEWTTRVARTDWNTGKASTLNIGFQADMFAVYERLSATPSVTEVRQSDLGRLLLQMLAFVGALFLLIELAAFLMGLSLARSITGSVHELFVGTERVRRGDFTHKIAIRSRDQLGELAASFNSMTSSIEDLLQQKAEKERMEQELLIARNIQMSLLPQGAFTIPGLSLTAHCEPAREVGGDYYDILPLDDGRVAVLIADVAGKGTSAALYMAELKGIILSLSQRHRSPRALLMDANRILARHLDTKTFITITYAVLDLDARTLTYARAGHCPLIHVPGAYAEERRAQVLVPDGMVLGLNLDAGQMFDRQLEECTLPLRPGDLFLLYTDGISEAMNADGDCFGDGRLSTLVEQHVDLPSDQLRERIVREVVSFAGTTVQQDDMTMLILKVDEAATAPTMTNREPHMAWSQS